MKKIAIISKGFIHPTILTQRIFVKNIRTISSDVTVYKNITKEINNFDFVILYFHEKSLKKDSLTALINYINLGKNLIIVHGALASFKEQKEYQNITGATFKGHDEITDIAIIDSNNNKIGDFLDELYLFDINDSCQIKHYGKTKSKKSPIYWINNYGNGKGKVHCYSLGHRKETIRNSSFYKIIKEILESDNE